MTASYFNLSLQDPHLQMQAAKEVIRSCPEDLELVACFLPGFLASANSQFHDLARGVNSFRLQDDRIRMPIHLPPETFFQNEEEAAAFTTSCVTF